MIIYLIYFSCASTFFPLSAKESRAKSSKCLYRKRFTPVGFTIMINGILYHTWKGSTL